MSSTPAAPAMMVEVAPAAEVQAAPKEAANFVVGDAVDAEQSQPEKRQSHRQREQDSQQHIGIYPGRLQIERSQEQCGRNGSGQSGQHEHWAGKTAKAAKNRSRQGRVRNAHSQERHPHADNECA